MVDRMLLTEHARNQLLSRDYEIHFGYLSSRRDVIKALNRDHKYGYFVKEYFVANDIRGSFPTLERAGKHIALSFVPVVQSDHNDEVEVLWI